MDQAYFEASRIMKPLIEIDFQGGTHGNFLDYVLNDCLSEQTIPMPFTDIGTSHACSLNYKRYHQFVQSNHFNLESNPFTLDNIIVIEVDENVNLLSLQSMTFYRAGDKKLTEDELINNTYNALTKIDEGCSSFNYISLLKNLCRSYNLELSETTPRCPRHILREFFKFQFKDPTVSEFVGPRIEWIKNLKNTGKKIYVFPMSSFYDYEKFNNEISKIEEFFDLNFIKRQYKHAHEKFMQGLTYFLNLNVLPDKIISAVQEKTELEFGNLTFLQESYINGNLERIYGKEMPFLQEDYFTNTKEIIEYLQL